MNWLAVDYGDARTGLAGCDEGEILVTPLMPQIEEEEASPGTNLLGVLRGRRKGERNGED